MKLADFQGYEIHLPTSGGKAGTGHNLTSTIQVRKENMVVKQIRFIVSDSESRKAAIAKAKAFCMSNASDKPRENNLKGST
jgi:hypothetical protein